MLTCIALIAGTCMLIHVLPIGGSFFQKVVAIKKFVHGDLTKEVDTEQKENSDLQKQFAEMQATVRNLRSASSTEISSKQELQAQLRESEENGRALDAKATRLKARYEALQAKEKSLEARMEALQRKNEQ